MHRRIQSFLVLALIALVPIPSSAQQRAVPSGKEQIQLSFAPIVRKAAPAVVNIYTKRLVQERVSPFADDPFFRRFFGDGSPFGGGTRKRYENSLGSGVIVRGDGVVVTNHHVIKDADTITVVLHDRREFDAEILINDERTDIAVLRIEVRNESLPYLEFGDADALEVGDMVLAIGNPFGIGQTVSSGIVSGLARTEVGITDFRSFIQTDAAINPGNSGGALVAMDGRLVGINTAIFSRTGGSVGIGFAVPSDMVSTIVRSAVSGKPLIRPWLSLGATEVSAEIASAMGLDRPGGILVETVQPSGPADKAGLKRGDVIFEVDRKAVDDVQSMRFRLAVHSIGDKVTMSVRRRGKVLHIPFALQAPPEIPPRDTTVLKGQNPLAGAKVLNLSPAVAAEVGFDESEIGVVAVEIARRSWAARIGLRPGDVILGVNGRKIGVVDDLEQATAQPSDRWLIEIRRGNKTLRVEVG
ncbi:MAG: Do family serine endopeptidase [Alphaproteobacteria bacterium]|nr:Do family serine endopeptidase [Alphaproteobacteria bacterium]